MRKLAPTVAMIGVTIVLVGCGPSESESRLVELLARDIRYLDAGLGDARNAGARTLNDVIALDLVSLDRAAFGPVDRTAEHRYVYEVKVTGAALVASARLLANVSLGGGWNAESATGYICLEFIVSEDDVSHRQLSCPSELTEGLSSEYELSLDQVLPLLTD